MTGFIIIYLVVTSVLSFAMALAVVSGDGGSVGGFFNLHILRKHIGAGWTFTICTLIISYLIMPELAICYWISRIFKRR